ncbi:MAG: prepilin-type N-terminal cleavage/methylation domain-containing protein [Planctomycetaceae bacterium]
MKRTLHCSANRYRSCRSRRGLTLLEMLLAASILAMSLAVLARQNGVGVRAALRSQLETGSRDALPVTTQSIAGRESVDGNDPRAAADGCQFTVSSLDVVSAGGAILSARPEIGHGDRVC